MANPVVHKKIAFLDYWRGKKELWKAFWIFGLLAFLIKLPGVYAIELDFPSAWWLSYVLIVVFSQVWWIVCVWRCASNAVRKLWAVLARVVVFFAGVNLILSLILLFT